MSWAVFGLEPSECLGRSAFDFIHPDDRRQTESLFKKWLDSGDELFTFDNRQMHKTGSYRHMFWMINKIPGGPGKPLGFLSVARDITERKKAEDKLRQSHSLLTAALESTADGILVVDTDERVTGFNRKFLELWRIPEALADERDDKKLLKFVLNQLRRPDEFIDKVNRLYRDKESDSFDELIFKDGRIFERYSRPQWIGDEVVGRVWSFRDVTERRQAEAAIRQSEQDYRTLAENLPGLVYRVYLREGGRMAFFNQMIKAMTGFSESELVSGDICRIEPMIIQEDRRLVVESVRKSLKIRKPFEVQYRIRHKSGSIRHFLERGRPVFGPDKKPLYIDGVIFDVTERVEFREQIQSQAASLEQKNAALKELLNQIIVEKKEVETRIYQNLDKLVMPKIKRLRSRADDDLRGQIELIEKDIKNIASAFGKKISASQRGLSAREIEVCDMIRSGLKNKAIARSLRLSIETIKTMRKTIRRKLKLRHKQVNLKTHLQHL